MLQQSLSLGPFITYIPYQLLNYYLLNNNEEDYFLRQSILNDLCIYSLERND